MKLSAALIMKNEEENLPRLLDSLQEKFDEIVVVDTGSTDKSIEIAKSYGCKVYEHTWNGFANARNYAISKCSGEWIWHFDADFELEEKEFEKFKKVVEFLDSKDIEALFVKVKNFGMDGTIKSISSQVFIHRNLPYIHWEGNIHEDLIIQKSSYDFDIYVNHYGYQKADIQLQKAKRNLSLLYKDLDENRENLEKYFIKLFYLFQTLSILAPFEQEILDDFDIYLQKYNDLAKKFEERDSLYFYRVYSLVYIAEIFLSKKDYITAKSYLERGCKNPLIYPDLYYKLGEVYQKNHQKEEAAKNFLHFLLEVEEYEKSGFKKDNHIVIIDYYARRETLIEEILPKLLCDEDMKELEQLWKRRRSKYIALLLIELLKQRSDEKTMKIAKKLYRIYSNDPFVLHYLLKNDTIVKIPVKNLATQLLNLNPNDSLAKKILGIEALQEEKFDEAIKYLSSVAYENGDYTVFNPLLYALEQAGYTKELEKIREKLKK